MGLGTVGLGAVSDPLPDGRPYAEAVKENFDDLLDQHRRREIDWRGADAQTVARYLEAGASPATAHVAEAFWRYYEWANP